MNETTNTTQKIHGGLLEAAENEVEAARTIYLRAYDAYIEQPTTVNRNEMYDAYKRLTEIKKLYAAGRKALIQKNVIEKQS
jgi:hypothetical protein